MSCVFFVLWLFSPIAIQHYNIPTIIHVRTTLCTVWWLDTRRRGILSSGEEISYSNGDGRGRDVFTVTTLLCLPTRVVVLKAVKRPKVYRRKASPSGPQTGGAGSHTHTNTRIHTRYRNVVCEE